MKRISIPTLLLLTLTAVSMKSQTVYEPMEQVVERGLRRATTLFGKFGKQFDYEFPPHVVHLMRVKVSK